MSKAESGSKHLLLAFKFYILSDSAKTLGEIAKTNRIGGVKTE